MGSAEQRLPKRDLLCRKAIVHFSLCFVVGFFTGIAPSSRPNAFSSLQPPFHPPTIREFPAKSEHPQPTEPAGATPSPPPSAAVTVNASDGATNDHDIAPKLLIVITTVRLATSTEPPQLPSLRRLGQTLSLVPPPLLWIVVERGQAGAETAEALRGTGVMYRHLVVEEEERLAGGAVEEDEEEELDRQRNRALHHVEQHRLEGIVHFTELSGVYDLRLFDEIRGIEVFGTWPVASVSANRMRVVLEGPVCNASQLLGWQFKDMVIPKNDNDEDNDNEARVPKINVSRFAFNSSILWDPERWGRPSSHGENSQDSIKFVQEVVMKDETKLKPIPPDCSCVMMWHLHVPRTSYIQAI